MLLPFLCNPCCMVATYGHSNIPDNAIGMFRYDGHFHRNSFGYAHNNVSVAGEHQRNDLDFDIRRGFLQRLGYGYLKYFKRSDYP